MHITILGAAGNMGRRVAAEALSRGHVVTAVVRSPDRCKTLPDGIRLRFADAVDAEAVAALAADADTLVSATRPSPGHESELAVVAETVLSGAAAAGTRVVLVGGAATLALPDGDGRTVIQDPDLVPTEWQPIARACAAQWAVCQQNAQADWTYLSPPAQLAPGTRTGNYRLGTDTLVVDGDGVSAISMEDLAVALVDEVETPQFRRARFTAAY